MSRLEAVLHCPWVGKENLREGGSTHRIKGSVGGGGGDMPTPSRGQPRAVVIWM